MKILHTSDCHLGLSRETDDAFAELICFARSGIFDVIVIVGDLFDHARVSQEIVEKAAAMLAAVPARVIILPGNHDLHGEGSVYQRFPSAENVTVISDEFGQFVSVDGDLTIWGKAMKEHSPAFRPLKGVPPRPESRFCVLLAHGTVVASDEVSLEGSPIYPRDLAPLDWDYIALGHIPMFRQITNSPVPAFYSGNTFNPIEQVAGAISVELSDQISVAWHRLDQNHPQST